MIRHLFWRAVGDFAIAAVLLLAQCTQHCMTCQNSRKICFIMSRRTLVSSIVLQKEVRSFQSREFINTGCVYRRDLFFLHPAMTMTQWSLDDNNLIEKYDKNHLLSNNDTKLCQQKPVTGKQKVGQEPFAVK